MPEQLWTQFNGRKFAAERAKSDWNGNPITAPNDSTITIKVADASTGPTAGTFTTNQASAGTVTIPVAVSAPSGGSATPGVMSAADKEKLDGISTGATKVEDGEHNGYISIDGVETNVYTHATDGANTSAGDTTAQTPGFGGTFKALSATVDQLGHTTALAEHTVTIPNATATASTGGTGGTDGLMSAADKEKLDNLVTVNDGTLSITVGSAAAQTFTANQAGNTTISIPNAASASGSTAATGGLMTDTDKANLDNATAVIPSTATAQNKLVDQAALESAIADFGGYKKANGTGTDMHPDVANPDTRFIYLVKDNSAAPGADLYKEWICTNTTGPVWELVGDTSMDMSGYVELPSTHTDTHIVVFGPNNDIVDSGKTVSELENVVTTVSVGSGSTISPTSGTTNINIPNATTSADGAMSSSDKAKLDGITDYLVSASVSNDTLTITPKNGSAITFTGDENVIESISVNGTAVTPDANKNVALTVPTAAASTDTPQMDGTAAVGSSDAYARADHVHPSDTTKADKVDNATDGNLAGLDANGNLTDSGFAPDDFLAGVQLEGAQSALTPSSSGVVTIPNAVATTGQNPTNGLMTPAQVTELDQIAAWTWSYAPFTDQGEGTEATAAFPFTVS